MKTCTHDTAHLTASQTEALLFYINDLEGRITLLQADLAAGRAELARLNKENTQNKMLLDVVDGLLTPIQRDILKG